ncbi:MAG TPA: hypothetical protein PKC19_20500, partial [Roseiflexaceae bacterium]|nr:hypothetical protein [Roseiflexaceae bacterium]
MQQISRRHFLRCTSTLLATPIVMPLVQEPVFGSLPAATPEYWIRLALQCIARTSMTPPRAARLLALIGIGMLRLVEQRRDAAALAGLAGTLLHALVPLATTLGLPIPPERPIAMAAARAFAHGERIAMRILEWAAADGATTTPPFEAPPVDRLPEGEWAPTPHTFASGIEPKWGELRPLLLPHGAALRVARPPAWHSDQFDRIRAEFVNVQQFRETEAAIARGWAYG